MTFFMHATNTNNDLTVWALERGMYYTCQHVFLKKYQHQMMQKAMESTQPWIVV